MSEPGQRITYIEWKHQMSLFNNGSGVKMKLWMVSVRTCQLWSIFKATDITNHMSGLNEDCFKPTLAFLRACALLFLLAVCFRHSRRGGYILYITSKVKRKGCAAESADPPCITLCAPLWLDLRGFWFLTILNKKFNSRETSLWYEVQAFI